MSEVLTADTFLPDVFILASQTWGILLADIAMLPQVFLILTALFILCASFFSIHGPADAIRALRFGLGTGASLLVLGFLGEGLGLLTTFSSPLIAIPSSVLALVGFLVLGGALLFKVHSVYEAAC